MVRLMDVVEKLLKKLSIAQIKFLPIMILIIILFTTFSLVGVTQIRLESDLSKLDPQDIPVTELNNKINTDFERFESTVIVVELDDSVEGMNLPHDIRDPRVIEFIIALDQNLREEPTIQSVQSVATIFNQIGEVPEDLEGVKGVLNQIPGTDELFDRGYEWTVIFIESDVGGDDVKIKALNERVSEILDSTAKPGGIKTTTTGDAPLFSAIFNLLLSDAFFTLIFATITIFILLIILERSLRRSLIILVPLIFGLTWSAGTMGWLGIPITIATAAMGAMLLGLGVEYSIFLNSRYKEARQTMTKEKAITIALTKVGTTLVSSGSTTLIGFMALSLSIFPVLADLGLTLGLGIGYMLLATIVASPVAILIQEKLSEKLKGEKEIKRRTKAKAKELEKIGLTKIYSSYGKFVSNNPLLVLLIALGITGLMIVGIGLIVNQDVDFETILPDDLEEIVAFIKLTDEFGDSSTLLIYVEIDNTSPGSNEPIDIRDPRVLNYIDVLTQKSFHIDEFESVTSISEIVKENNDGKIPDTIASEREIFESFQAKELINNDFSASIVRISVNEDALDDETEIVNQLKKIISETSKPAGVTTLPSGGGVVNQELNALNGPDSTKTSLLALAGIVIFLYLLTRSAKNTILPLLTVVLGIIWTLGLTGFFRVPFNNITTSVITMTIGIGIDFGLQVINRFNQELAKFDKRKAMEVTLTNVLNPMVITVIAALIGFRAMGLGELKIMGDLGILMSFGIAGSMLVAISAVASIVLIFQRGNGNKNE